MVKDIIFFYHSFGCPKVNFQSLATRQPLLLDANHLLVAVFNPMVTGGLSKVEYLSPVECAVEFEPATFRL